MNALRAGLVLIALAAAGSASAAEPPPAPAPAPYPVAPPVYRPLIYNWTGFYIGAHLGGGWTRAHWRDGVTGLDISSHNNGGFIGGLQGGYNWNSLDWLVGVEVQSSWGSISNGADWIDPIDPIFPRKRTGSTIENIGTVAVRVGRTWDRSLFYVKGGAAWAYEVYDLFVATATTTPLLGSASITRGGWMAGVGFEYAFLDNWSAKIEYDYLAFGTERVTVFGAGNRSFDVRQDISVVKFGVNYRFGGLFGY
jgi:outer membrane immunogenic protein